MGSLRQQVLAVIETCEQVIASKSATEQPDATTFDIASTILGQAKQEVPGDKVLATVKLDVKSWTGILSAMKIVERSLPLPRPAAATSRFRR